ncbi:hypothetical protein Efla_000065 [Eimeria flavescens]
MVWTDWWPHDRVPQPAGLNPYRVYCEQGKVYWWCSCGKCATQPWCDMKNRAANALQADPTKIGNFASLFVIDVQQKQSNKIQRATVLLPAAGCKPVLYIPKLTGWKLLSGSKFTECPPFSVATHFWVKCHKNTPLGCLSVFGMAFSAGVFSTYLMHG